MQCDCRHGLANQSDADVRWWLVDGAARSNYIPKKRPPRLWIRWGDKNERVLDLSYVEADAPVLRPFRHGRQWVGGDDFVTAAMIQQAVLHPGRKMRWTLLFADGRSLIRPGWRRQSGCCRAGVNDRSCQAAKRKGSMLDARFVAHGRIPVWETTLPGWQVG
jgi:hypothetical protein